jgi:hypothetical protein
MKAPEGALCPAREHTGKIRFLALLPFLHLAPPGCGALAFDVEKHIN